MHNTQDHTHPPNNQEGIISYSPQFSINLIGYKIVATPPKNDISINVSDSNDHLFFLEQELTEIENERSITKRELRLAETQLNSTIAKKNDIEEKINNSQNELISIDSTQELYITELKASLKELKDLLGNNIENGSAISNKDKIVLAKTVDQTRAMFDALQESILKDISESIKIFSVRFGVRNISDMKLDAGGRLRIDQGGASISGLTHRDVINFCDSLCLSDNSW